MMQRQHLIFALPIACAMAVGAAAISSWSAGAGQNQLDSARGPVVQVHCSRARGISGIDFARVPSGEVCLMSRRASGGCTRKSLSSPTKAPGTKVARKRGWVRVWPVGGETHPIWSGRVHPNPARNVG
jgi:hypothetical protein